jgi:hypothetical protein
MATKIKLASKSFRAKHYLEINAFVEVENKERYTQYEDVVFISCSADYDRAKMITMQVRNIDLRALAYGLKEILKNGTSSYAKYTDPKAAGGTGNKKSITLGKDKGMFYINFNDKTNAIAFGFDAYSMASLADIIILMAEVADQKIFAMQTPAVDF